MPDRTDSLPQLPPGWERYSRTQYRRKIGAYTLLVTKGRGRYIASARLIDLPIVATAEACADSLPSACRRAEELLLELAAWRPPALNTDSEEAT